MPRFDIPGDLFARHQTITGLRALADYLETHPAVPVNEYGWEVRIHTGVGRDTITDADQRAEVDRVAALLGVPALDETVRGGHYKASRTFGRIVYTIVHVPARRMAQHRAEQSYRDNIRLDHAHQDNERDQDRAA
jgi:hypothetical protein